MSYAYIVHYAEIGLKGKNRPDFEHQLMRNIRTQFPGTRVARHRGRLSAYADSLIDLSNVMGVAWWAQVQVVPQDLDELRSAVLKFVGEKGVRATSFAIRAKVRDEVFLLGSRDLEVDLGSLVQSQYDLAVDLTSPDLTIFIEASNAGIFMFNEKRLGPGGLPVGISGKMVGLYSAGIDSVVAAYLMAKRGAAVDLVHFYATATAERAHALKAGELALSLSRFIPNLSIHYLPYHEFQLATAGLRGRAQRQELVIFRRLMAMCAQRIAVEETAGALFTGDNLGQVASQTLENLAAVDRVAEMPIFRPLIAYNKQEIINFGDRLDLYEIAKGEYKDCCSIIAKHPATIANIEIMEDVESKIDLAGIVENILVEKKTIRLAGETIEVSKPQPTPA